MSVYKPAKSPYWHYDFVYKGRRFHGSTGQTARSKAERVETAQRLKAAAGEPDKRAVPTLDQAAQEWWTFKGQSLKSAATLEARLADAVTLIGKDTPVDQITTSDIAEAIQLRRGRLVRGKTVPKNATVNRDIIDTIRPILRRQRKLLNDGKGRPVPFPEIDWKELRLSEPRPNPRDFTAAEVEAIIQAAPIWWHDFIRLQLRYACRLSEMFFGLAAIDVPGRRVTLRDRKNGGIHVIPLLSDDVAMLAARIGRAEAAKIDTVWFRELKSGKLKPLTRNGALQALRRAMRAAGLHARKGAKGSHDLRHHAAMQVLRGTGNIRLAQKLLGHEDIKSTLVYAHALEDDLRAGLEQVAGKARPAKKVRQAR